MVGITNRISGKGHIGHKAKDVGFLGMESWHLDAIRNTYIQ